MLTGSIVIGAGALNVLAACGKENQPTPVDFNALITQPDKYKDQTITLKSVYAKALTVEAYTTLKLYYWGLAHASLATTQHNRRIRLSVYATSSTTGGSLDAIEDDVAPVKDVEEKQLPFDVYAPPPYTDTTIGKLEKYTMTGIWKQKTNQNNASIPHRYYLALQSAKKIQ